MNVMWSAVVLCLYSSLLQTVLPRSLELETMTALCSAKCPRFVVKALRKLRLEGCNTVRQMRRVKHPAMKIVHNVQCER